MSPATAGVRQYDYSLDTEAQTCAFPLDADVVLPGDVIRVRYPYRTGVPIPDNTSFRPYSSTWKTLVVSEFDSTFDSDPRKEIEYDDSAWPMVKFPVGKNDAFPANIIDDESWLPVVPNGTAIEFSQSVWIRHILTTPVRLHFRMDANVWVYLNGTYAGGLWGQSGSSPKDERPNAPADATGGAVPIPFDIGPGVLAIFASREVRAGYDGHYLDIETEELP